jgi:hypothetical protein
VVTTAPGSTPPPQTRGDAACADAHPGSGRPPPNQSYWTLLPYPTSDGTPPPDPLRHCPVPELNTSTPHLAHWGVAEARTKSCHTASDDAAQAVDVEAASPHCLNLVLQDGGHLITAQVGHS